jgi:hypothetical protein
MKTSHGVVKLGRTGSDQDKHLKYFDNDDKIALFMALE